MLKHFLVQYHYKLYCIVISLVLLIVVSSSIEAQKSDSDSVKIDTSSIFYKHPPKKATWMSVFVPGLGQIYNHQWWKVPFIYAGLVGFAYGQWWNLQQEWKFKEIQRNHYQIPVTINKVTVWQPVDQSSVDDGFLYYERDKELCDILFCGIYIANIIDATVYAYLFEFDVSKSLSMQLTPTLLTPTTIGITCSLQIH